MTSGAPAPNLMFSTSVHVLPLDEEKHPTYPEFSFIDANTERSDAVYFSDEKLPMAIVYGSPYEMGYNYGLLMAGRIRRFAREYLNGKDDAQNGDNWEKVVDNLDPRILEEIEGLSDGSGVSLNLLQMAHARALYQFDDYTTAAVAAYRDMMPGRDAVHTVTINALPPPSAKPLETGDTLQDHLIAVLYVPEKGVPHIVFTYAGLAFGLTGVNLAGISINNTLEPDAAAGNNSAPLVRSVLYDALSLREAADTIAATPPARASSFIITDGRNEKRAVRLRFSDSGQMLEERYDLAKSVFGLERPGIVYGAGSAVAQDSLASLLTANIATLTRTKLLTIAGTVPTAMTGYNILNVGYEFVGSDLMVYVAVARDGMEAYQDYFDQIFMQQLLP